jgi:hypothetical protein
MDPGNSDTLPPEKSLDELVIESARLAVQLRKRFKSGHGNQGRYYTYVLLLQDECIYVGSSNNIYIRLMEHHYDPTMSSNWVREHGPVIRVLEVIRDSSPVDETYKTLEYMSLFGWESVRGAGWCKIDIRQPAALTLFERTRADFNYLTRTEIDDVLRISKDLYDTMCS